MPGPIGEKFTAKTQLWPTANWKLAFVAHVVVLAHVKPAGKVRLLTVAALVADVFSRMMFCVSEVPGWMTPKFNPEIGTPPKK